MQYTNVLLYDYVWVRYLKQCQIQFIIFTLKILSQVLKIAFFGSTFRALCVCVLLTAQFFILMSLAWKIHSTPFQNMKNLF